MSSASSGPAWPSVTCISPIRIPLPGQEGAEQGVRLEVRLLVRGPLPGSAYSARPIGVGRPVWRADLLESADGPPGSFDRTHYHPQLDGWEPGRRVYDRNLSAHPVEWVGARLAAWKPCWPRPVSPPDPAYAGDAEALRGCLAEIMDTVGRLLERVRRGELGRAAGRPRRGTCPAGPGCKAAPRGSQRPPASGLAVRPPRGGS